MASLFVPTNSASLAVSFPRHLSRALFSEPSHVVIPPVARFSGACGGLAARLRNRGCSVVTRAGPSTSSYLFAFAIPLSLIAVTVFTSIKIADKLDEDFLEEVALNQAMREAEEEDGDEAEISLDEIVQEPVLRRTRNRPKREA